MDIIDKIRNGWDLAVDSFGIIMENKSLLVFPVFSTISLILVLLSFFGGIHAPWYVGIENISNIKGISRYLLIFIFYFINYTIIVFFNTGLIYCTLKILNGDRATVGDGMIFSLSKIGSILLWALLSATVGVILQIIEDRHEIIKSLVTNLLGALWSLATFFVIPVMVHENLDVFQAIKRSTLLFRDTWGQRVGASFSFGLLVLAASIVFILIACFLLFALNMFNFTAWCTITIAFILIISCISSAAETIFQASVYQSVVGNPAELGRARFNNIFS